MRLMLILLVFLLTVPVSATNHNRIEVDRIEDSRIFWLKQYRYRVMVNVSFWFSSLYNNSRDCVSSLTFSQHILPWLFYGWETQERCLPRPVSSVQGLSFEVVEFEVIFTSVNSTHVLLSAQI
ncbi:MAG: hypothetical protein D6732_18025 [Methanobacteriota archaeon]|nr:MAG: hypothetical protein D6732_18025 [Euryarchaeota archaeon]